MLSRDCGRKETISPPTWIPAIAKWQCMFFREKIWYCSFEIPRVTASEFWKHSSRPYTRGSVFIFIYFLYIKIYKNIFLTNIFIILIRWNTSFCEKETIKLFCLYCFMDYAFPLLVSPCVNTSGWNTAVHIYSWLGFFFFFFYKSL